MAGAISATRALRRLNQYKQGKTVQPGMFSTLDEAIQEAPFDVNSADQWAKYLTPGRMVKRKGAQFPLKKEELESSGLAERLSSGIFADQPITKEVLQDHLRSSRPEFRVDVGKEIYDEHGLNPMVTDSPMLNSWEEVGKLGDIDSMSGELVDLGRVTSMDPKFGGGYGGEGQYHHTSPNSTYEESFTRLKGLVAPTHHTEDTLSWSRITTHNLPQKSTEMGYWPQRVRLVEEIQADIHRKAAGKLWYDPTGKQHYTSEDSALRSSLDPDLVEDAGRIGYRTDDTALEIAGLKEMEKSLDVKLRNSDPITAGGNVSKKYVKMQDEYKDLVAELTRLEMKMDNAPHKKPQDYAQLELRKQLMNAADDGEDYLALARGRDQIERYSPSGELDSRQRAGLERMYDEVYAGELRKLAKRYGATVEDIEVQVNRHLDPDATSLPEPMASMGLDDVDELTSAAYNALGVGSDASKADAKEFLGVMYESMRDVNWVEGADQKGAARIAERIQVMEAEVDRLWDRAYNPEGADAYALDEWNLHVDGKWSELEADFKGVIDTWQTATNVGQDAGMMTKSFPAIKITPEVRERILELGVSQFQLGGLVRPDRYGGQEYIPSMEQLSEMPEPDLERLRDINYTLTGGTPKRELLERMEEAELYEDPQYWKDVPKHVLASMSSLWKTLDPETGKAVWNFGASPPPFEMVERGIMPLDEWKEMKEVADRVREEKPAKPGIIDETISMRVLMTEIANIFREDREEPPEYAAEAMERTERLQKAVEEGMDLDPAVGFPQRFAQMMGFMLGQVPSPKSATEAFGVALVKMMPKVTAKIPKAVKVGVGAPLEFMDPTIRPSAASYLTGAGAGTGILYGIEAAAESKLKALEEKFEEEEAPQEFAGGGKVASALMKLRTVGERMLKERVAERKGGMEDWSRDYRDELRELTGIDDPFTPADPSGPIIGHPNLEDYPAGYFPDDEVAAEMRRLYKAVENLGPHTGGQYAGKQLISDFPEDADLGELLDLSRRVRDVEEVEWQHSVEVGRAERQAEELAKWGDPGSDPHAYREAQSIELTNRVITDNEEHIIGEMRRMADEANRNPRVFQQLTEEDMFFDPIINAPKGGGDYDDFFGSFGNFGPETDMIGDLWIKALGDEFKYKKISRRLKQIQEEGL